MKRKSCLWNFNLKSKCFLVLQTPSEMSIKAIRVEYAEFIALLSVLQVNVDMNLKVSENCKILIFWNFNSNLKLIAFLHFRF